jgi:hypothetical protein
LLGDKPRRLKLKNIKDSAIGTLKNVIGYHSSNWSSLKFDVDLPDNH